MNIKELDYIFPFVVFGYGALMMFVLNSPALMKMAEKNLSSELFSSFQSKRVLSVVCFIIGGLWSLQNIWLG
jgi:hypothetical protein